MCLTFENLTLAPTDAGTLALVLVCAHTRLYVYTHAHYTERYRERGACGGEFETVQRGKGRVARHIQRRGCKGMR